MKTERSNKGVQVHTLLASLLGNMLAGKGVTREWSAQTGFLITPHPLTYFEIQTYYQNEPKFKYVFSQNDSPNTVMGG